MADNTIKRWPDGPDYFTKTDVDGIVRELPANARMLGLPFHDANAEVAFIVNFPLLTMRDECV